VRAVVLAIPVAWVCGDVTAAAGAERGSASVRDVGIFSDLDAAVQVTLPPHVDSGETWLRLDDTHRDVVLYEGDVPLKVYPLARALRAGPGKPAEPAEPISAPALVAELGAADAAELRGLVSSRTRVERVAPGKNAAADDADGDGIPDQIDILMGARKLVLNHAIYTEGYVRISYPQGDVPRTIGVCSDTIIRAFRNAGIDLQRRIAEDIRASPSAYPGITHPNTSIDHRRVKTLLTWFERHVPQVRGGPLRPGDVVFLDTFPNRPGPDHVGIISDRMAPSGRPFVINNWTVGYREGEMDLLPSIPVTHRFRMK
jgi:uncharacterized protein YijF (DUF1287 family)